MKKRIFKKVTAGIILILVVSLLAACGKEAQPNNTSPVQSQQPQQSQKPTEGGTKEPAKTKVLKLADDGHADMPIGIGLAAMAEEVEKLSNGTLKIDIYHNAQLGQEGDVLDGIKMGSIDMMKANGGNMAGHVNELNAFTLPFIFRDQEHSWNVFNGAPGQLIKDSAEAKGFKVLTFYEEGARHIYSNKGFVKTPGDLKGLKIRIMGAASIQDGFKALNASPVPMAFGEVYNGLSQGTIEAAENSFPSIYGGKFHEVAKYVTETGHLRIPALIIIGMNQWNDLTDSEKEILQKAADLSREVEIEAFNRIEKENIEMIKAEGGEVYMMSNEERQEFAKLVTPVYEKYKESLGAELIDGIINTK